ncbi:MAG: hypothetical protein KQI35_15460 [Bacteroidetes bacterium]|nr:hypothetical protein [Bacteroidota bacterium]
MVNISKYIYSRTNSNKLIKYTAILIVLSLNIQPVFSQKDTVAPITDSIIQYITPLEYAFMMHEETSWLFKGSLLLNFEYSNRLYYKIGIEKRIASSFTLNLSIDQSIYENLGEEGPISNGIKTSLESRWYYRLNRRVKENKVARNMSDNYFALGVDYTRLFKNKDIDEYWQPENNNYLTLFIKWGLQRRFLKHGHADVGIKLGATNPTNQSFSPTLLLGTYVDLGLAFAKDSYKLNQEKLCPVLKCYESTKHLFKSDLSNLFGIGFDKNTFSFHVSPHIGFERKIGHSPLSINTEINGLYMFTKYLEHLSSDPEYLPRRSNLDYISVEALLETRYYYNLKRRINKGKTGNGLSADYLAMGGSYKYTTRSFYDQGSFMPNIFISTGWQRVIGKHFYYDINIGLEYKFEVLNSHGFAVQEKGIEPRFRIAVGYRF